MVNSDGKTRSGSMARTVLCFLGTFIALALLVGLTIFLMIWFLGGNEPVAETANGRIKGRNIKSPNGPMVEEFLGIPFAKPPIDERRYADPEPIDGFSEDPYPALEYGNTCPGYIDETFGDFQGSDMWNAKTELSEDCLYLNVWVPKHKKEEKLAVMVWIFGGGFYSGSSALWVYDGKALAGHGDVIVVSMNYRVGSFGFLSSGDWRIPGNYGLKDQSLALKWIKDNIAAFGGDHERITLFGESAGASSVGYHLLAEQSQPLFNRSIFQSGSPDSHWSFMSQGDARSRSGQFFSNVQCEDNNDVLFCLRSKSTEDIMLNDWTTSEFMEFPWAPTIDGEFVKESPYSMLYSRNFPKDKEVLMGVNEDEGSFWLLYSFEFLNKDNESLTTNQQYMDAVDTIEWDLSTEDKILVRNRYQPANPLSGADNRDALDDAVGDRTFVCPTYELAKVLGDAGITTYFYQLSYRASNEVWPPWMGVIHGADIQWIFGMPLDKSRGYSDPSEVDLSLKIINYWTNFAKTGDPNKNSIDAGLPNKPPEWRAFGVDSRPMLNINGWNNNDIKMFDATAKYSNTCSFWWKYHTEIQAGKK